MELWLALRTLKHPGCHDPGLASQIGDRHGDVIPLIYRLKCFDIRRLRIRNDQFRAGHSSISYFEPPGSRVTVSTDYFCRFLAANAEGGRGNRIETALAYLPSQ